ncbi:MAG: hypothetical protein KDD42_00980, partial [Bdellovibrionales bacterium]|nr:hypothetical protein [Bdellovibrionales bacterium]
MSKSINNGAPVGMFICNDPIDCSWREYINRLVKNTLPQVKIMNQVRDEPFSKAWFLRTHDRILRSEVVTVLIGEGSWISKTVAWELECALALKKSLVILNLNS